MKEPLNYNQLYPIFLKLDQIEVLIVGGGTVGTEKLNFMMKSSPNARVTVVAHNATREIEMLSHKFENIKILRRKFINTDLNNKDLIIIATENISLNKRIYHFSKKLKILTNVADTPHLCDFYLGSIVTKGDLKIAISTNGKSPTFSKRLRQYFEQMIPDNISESLEILRRVRDRINGDFESKVKRLNEITSVLVAEINEQK